MLFCCSPEPGIAGSAAGRTAGRHGQRGWGGRQENRPARHRGKSSLPSHHRGAQSGTRTKGSFITSCLVLLKLCVDASLLSVHRYI